VLSDEPLSCSQTSSSEDQSTFVAEESEQMSAFDGLAVSAESVDRFLINKNRYDVTKQVCICGHAINKHYGYEKGFGSCLTAKHSCPCTEKIPVVYANDTRYFMRKTYGPGSRHALSTGLMRVRQVGKQAFWLEKPQCWNSKCYSNNPNIYPVALDLDGIVLNEPGPKNVLMCETCYLNIKGVPGNEGKGWIW
jgi:hypothetical protein